MKIYLIIAPVFLSPFLVSVQKLKVKSGDLIFYQGSEGNKRRIRL